MKPTTRWEAAPSVSVPLKPLESLAERTTHMASSARRCRMSDGILLVRVGSNAARRKCDQLSARCSERTDRCGWPGRRSRGFGCDDVVHDPTVGGQLSDVDWLRARRAERQSVPALAAEVHVDHRRVQRVAAWRRITSTAARSSRPPAPRRRMADGDSARNLDGGRGTDARVRSQIRALRGAQVRSVDDRRSRAATGGRCRAGRP